MSSKQKKTNDYGTWRTFFGEFRRNFETTGSVLPSSRFLARAIVRHAHQSARPARILEAGPGTGPFTDQLIRQLEPEDRLVLVELNDRFVEILHRRLENDPVWQTKRSQVEVFHGPAEDLPESCSFHAIVCGLPFNNFHPELVDQLFRQFIDRLEPEGTFSFFEYLWIRSVKSVVAGAEERRRLAAVGKAMGSYLEQYRIGCDRVVLNVPPAVVHHLKKPANANGPGAATSSPSA